MAFDKSLNNERLLTEIYINDARFSHLSFSIESSCSSPIDSAQIFIENREDNFSGLFQIKDRVEIHTGYVDTGLYVSYSGYIKSIEGTGLLNIKCGDEMWLQDQKADSGINNRTHRNVTPQEILSCLMFDIGFSAENIKLDSTRYRKKRSFMIRDESFIGIIKKINSVWGIENDYFFRYNEDGVKIFHWGTEPDDLDQISRVKNKQNLVEGVNVINIVWDNNSKTGRLKTVYPLFFLSHSDTAIIRGRELLQDRYKITRVQHRVSMIDRQRPHSIVKFKPITAIGL